MKYEFTIEGNQEDPEGNPIPYFRTTQNSTWSKGAKRYGNWKLFVQSVFLRKYRGGPDRKPISGSPRGSITASIVFRGEQHGDPDNVVKGLLDALFMNDKEMDVSTSHSCNNKKGQVYVKIELPELCPESEKPSRLSRKKISPAQRAITARTRSSKATTQRSSMIG